MPDQNLALFQFVYVKDIQSIIIQCIGNPSVYNEAYNLSAPEMISYDKLAEALEDIAQREILFERYSMEEINDNEIPLPFPLEQHELYSGDKIARALGFEYTPFIKGMKETYEFFLKYYRK